MRKSKAEKRFHLFVKVLDSEGMVDESACGWLKLGKPLSLIPVKMSKSSMFVEKERGHGSAEDWKEFFEEDHPDWRITVVWEREPKTSRKTVRKTSD